MGISTMIKNPSMLIAGLLLLLLSACGPVPYYPPSYTVTPTITPAPTSTP